MVPDRATIRPRKWTFLKINIILTLCKISLALCVYLFEVLSGIVSSIYFLVSRKKEKKTGFINLTCDLEKRGSSSPEMNEAWFSSTLLPGLVRVSLPRERMIKEQGYPSLI